MTDAHLVGVDECGGQGEAVDEELGGDDAVMTTVGAGVLAEVLVQQLPRLVAAPEAARKTNMTVLSPHIAQTEQCSWLKVLALVCWWWRAMTITLLT